MWKKIKEGDPAKKNIKSTMHLSDNLKTSETVPVLEDTMWEWLGFIHIQHYWICAS